MTFKVTFCNPLIKDIIVLGFFSQGQILDAFNKTNWTKYLESTNGISDDKIYYSPSLEIENVNNKNSLAISVVGDANNYEFYIFYKRPKTIKLFGFFKKINDQYLTSIQGQTKEDAIKFITALIKNNIDLLDLEIK